MNFVRIKDKGQVTIPAAVREQMSVGTGDLLEVAIENGAIVLKPREVVSRKKKGKKPDLADWIGKAKGVYGSVEEVDAYIRGERDSWE